MAINGSCPCPKTKCTFYGKCKECIEKHKNSFTYCRQPRGLELIKK